MLHFETAFLSPRERIRMQVASYILLLFFKPENNLLWSQIKYASLAPRKSFISPVSTLLTQEAELVAGVREVEHIVPHPLTPWHENNFVIEISDSVEDAVEDHKALLQSEDIAWHYYTDGSRAEGNVAVGIVSYDKFLDKWNSCSYYVGLETCFGIYEAELLVIYMALLSAYTTITTNNTYKPQNIYIHSDNQAALQALQSASADGSAQYILKKIINKIEETETYSPATYVNLNKLLVDFELKQSLSDL